MTFISYAQNFEDVMLRRVLKHVENGFYIDVGAQDPSADSVTKLFTIEAGLELILNQYQLITINW